MNSCERFAALIAIAEKLGYQIRFESLAGRGGGFCHAGHKKWLFVDLTLSTRENLERLEAELPAIGCDTATITSEFLLG